jgi:hypothetical protein
VGLAGTAFAHQYHGFSALYVAAFGQFADLCRRNLPRLVEVELFQRLQPRQFGIAQPLPRKTKSELLERTSREVGQCSR